MNKTFFLGLLAGAAMGAVLGMLVAPQAGGTMRKTIFEATKPAREKVGGLVVSFKAKAFDTAESVRQAI